MNLSRVLAIALWVLLSACAPASHVLVGVARAPIPVEQVVIYAQAPANSQDVAILDASSSSAFSPGGQRVMDKVIQRLKVQAAQLGANGVVLQGFSDAVTGSLGTGLGSESYSRNSSVGVGAGGSLGIFRKTGKGMAIYVPPPDR
ncbi:MAG TPA: hypothetical protein VN925_01525 [Steroidobacteraceae bacterium]|nr:hypothetical protein [Steroidobacteraceae bacterium]